MPMFVEHLQILQVAMLRDETELGGLFNVDVTFLRDRALSPELSGPPSVTRAVGPSIFTPVQE